MLQLKHTMLYRENVIMSNFWTFVLFIFLPTGTFQQADDGAKLTEVAGGAEIFIEEPADGEIVSLSPEQDSIDLVAYADGSNVTANCVFILQFGGRRAMYYRFTAFASDANRGMLHTSIRGLSSTNHSTFFDLILAVAILTQTGDSHAAVILATSKISVRIDPPNAARGEYGFGSLRAPLPAPEPEQLGIRSGFSWMQGGADGILTGPWPLPCPDMPVRTADFPPRTRRNHHVESIAPALPRSH